MVKFGNWAAILGFALSASTLHADPDSNIQIMTDAARKLTWYSWEADNRANLLVKQETEIAPVAVIFGYADNSAACEALANALSMPTARAGTFKCQPIY